jgi:hypothetical protein
MGPQGLNRRLQFPALWAQERRATEGRLRRWRSDTIVMGSDADRHTGRGNSGARRAQHVVSDTGAGSIDIGNLAEGANGAIGANDGDNDRRGIGELDEVGLNHAKDDAFPRATMGGHPSRQPTGKGLDGARVRVMRSRRRRTASI